MTKTQIALTAILDGQVSADILEQVMAATASVRAEATGPAKQIEIDGKAYRLCSKHNVYEPIEWFPTVGTDGKYNPACRAAVARWSDLGKQITEAGKAGEFETLGRLTMERKGKNYILSNDIEEFAEALEEFPQDINDAQPLQ